MFLKLQLPLNYSSFSNCHFYFRQNLTATRQHLKHMSKASKVLEVNVRFMVSLSPFIVEIGRAPRSPGRKSLVCNNEAVFTKSRCFLFPVLELTLNTPTTASILRWADRSSARYHSSSPTGLSRGRCKPQRCSGETRKAPQSPETRWQRLLREASPADRLPSVGAGWDPPDRRALLQSAPQLQFWDSSARAGSALGLGSQQAE